jgi:hypothetical protein
MAPHDVPQRRKDERYVTLYRAACIITDCGHEQLGLIRNISCGGLMLETHAVLFEGQRLRIEAKRNCSFVGTVIWAQPNIVGVEFDEPLDVVRFLSVNDGPGSPQQARAPRLHTKCAARLRTETGWQSVRLRDLSQGGAKVEVESCLPLGEKVELQVHDLPPVIGHVRWARDNQLGLAFSSAIPFADLSRWASERADGR